MSAALPPPSPAGAAQTVSRYCQGSLGRQNCSRLKTTELEERFSRLFQLKLYFLENCFQDSFFFSPPKQVISGQARYTCFWGWITQIIASTPCLGDTEVLNGTQRRPHLRGQLSVVITEPGAGVSVFAAHTLTGGNYLESL